MLLPLFVLVIITVVLVIAYQNTKKNDTTTKTFLILSYIVVLGICFKFGVIQNNKFLEGFEVEIPDTDDMINNSPTVTSEDDDIDNDMINNLPTVTSEDDDMTADDTGNNMVDDDIADDMTADDTGNNMVDDDDTEYEPLDEDLVTLNNNSRNNNSRNSNNKAYKGATLNDLAKLENINSPLNNLKSQTNNTAASNNNTRARNNNASNNNTRASNNNANRSSNNANRSSNNANRSSNNANRSSNNAIASNNNANNTRASNNNTRARNNNARASNNNTRASNNNTTNVTREGFNDIVQHDTNGTSSVFRPQIIINTNDGLKTDEMNMNIPNVNLNMDLNMDNTDNNDTESMSNIPFNKNQRSKFMSANKKENLFNNNSIKSTESEQQDSNIIYNVNQEQKSDAFTWLNEFTNKRQHGTDNSRSYTTHNTLNNNKQTAESFNNGNNNSRQCATFRPYAVETGAGPVYIDYDRKTLTNRTYIPGVQYMPPTTWHVPQPHMHTQCRNVCNNTMVNTRALPIAMMDRGTPVNALEIGYDGTIAKSEEEVRLTNIGSILPKFEYKEYIDCYKNPYANATTTTASNPRTPVSLD